MLAAPTQAMESLSIRKQKEEAKHIHSSKPFYLAQVDEMDGSLKNGHPERQFRVEIGSEVRFHIMRGGKVSKETLLLVNQVRDTSALESSLINADGHSGNIEYTTT